MILAKKYFSVILSVCVFIIYLFTLAPSVVQIDSGELAAVQATLGIAHPTGYPLFTIVGYLFSLIPLPFTKIYQLNLLAAIYCSAAAGIFSYTAKYLLDNLSEFHITKPVKQKKKDKTKKEYVHFELEENLKIIFSVLAALTLAFSKTFWFQSTSVEVYSFHLLLISLIILFLLKAFIEQPKSSKIYKNHWMIFAFVLALGFSNHMTTLLILPGTAYLYFTKEKFNSQSFKNLLKMITLFLIVLVINYSYLPIRASQNPQLNWGNPVDLERILRHISGFQYQVWLFSSTEAAKKQLQYFISNLPAEYLLTLFVAAAGLLFSFFTARKFFLFNLITFITTVIYSINYDISDIDSYFLLAYISIAFFSLFGLIKIFQILYENKLNQSVIFLILLLFPVSQFVKNFPEVNQSKTVVYENYTKALMNSVPDNALVLSYQWDFFISASYYFQFVEKFKPQIAIVDKELLRRSWYYNQLERNYPGLLSGLRNDINLFLNALKPFERKENYNASLLENLYRRIMMNLVATNFDKHEIYIAPEIFDNEMQRGEFSLPKGYKLVPHLFLFKVVNNDEYVEAPLPDFKLNFSERKDKYQTSLSSFVGLMLVRRAYYELQYNKPERAKIYLKKVAEDFPETQIPQQLRSLILD
ncbi:MAG: glycosyltransferase family 117 protein [Ignavibacterium sp.]|uniref:glycosyltransferase family 117 protein n=1 Tax=Ignavibacterium sp. TaxID=2651167 RepID=UPI00404A5C31